MSQYFFTLNVILLIKTLKKKIKIILLTVFSKLADVKDNHN